MRKDAKIGIALGAVVTVGLVAAAMLRDKPPASDHASFGEAGQRREVTTHCEACVDLAGKANRIQGEIDDAQAKVDGLEDAIDTLRQFLADAEQGIIDTRQALQDVRNSFKVPGQAPDEEELDRRIAESADAARGIEERQGLADAHARGEIGMSDLLERWSSIGTIERLDDAGLQAAQDVGAKIEALEKLLAEQLKGYEKIKTIAEKLIGEAMKELAEAEADVTILYDDLLQALADLKACEDEHCDGSAGECFDYIPGHTGGALGTPVIQIRYRDCGPGEEPGASTDPTGREGLGLPNPLAE